MKMKAPCPSIDIKNRLALSIAEAAQVIGLSENAFRSVLPDIERIQVGRRVLIPVKALETWLESRARLDAGQDEEIISEMLKAVR